MNLVDGGAGLLLYFCLFFVLHYTHTPTDKKAIAALSCIFYIDLIWQMSRAQVDIPNDIKSEDLSYQIIALSMEQEARVLLFYQAIVSKKLKNINIIVGGVRIMDLLPQRIVNDNDPTQQLYKSTVSPRNLSL